MPQVEKGFAMCISISEARRRYANNNKAKNRLRTMRAFRLRERGYSHAEIAKQLGMSEAYVRAVLRKTAVA